jgi:hypothetical protein
VRLELGLALERRQLGLRTIATSQRQAKQEVGKVRILWEERTVKVGAKYIPIPRAFRSILSVIARAKNHSSERQPPRTEKRSPAVIFESDDLERLSCKVHLNDRIADEPAISGHRPGIEHADAGQHVAVGEFEVLPKELVRPANGQYDDVSCDGVAKRSAGVALQIAADRDLIAILSATSEDHVITVEPTGFADAALDDVCLDSAPSAALREGDDVSAVAVDVHPGGIQVADIQSKYHGYSSQNCPA